VKLATSAGWPKTLHTLPEVSPSSQGNNTDPYYYVYGYQGTDVNAAKATDNYTNYGALYNWPASLNACPEGWHLPTDAEWTILTTYLGGEECCRRKNEKHTHSARSASPLGKSQHRRNKFKRIFRSSGRRP
jgi:uncharacterized protein (TIGR02145 family)